MEKRRVNLPKADVERLSEKQLEDLIGWGSHDGYAVMLDVSEDALRRKLDDLAGNPDMDDDERLRLIDSIALMKEALDYLYDSKNRAEEELKRRNK